MTFAPAASRRPHRPRGASRRSVRDATRRAEHLHCHRAKPCSFDGRGLHAQQRSPLAPCQSLVAPAGLLQATAAPRQAAAARHGSQALELHSSARPALCSAAMATTASEPWPPPRAPLRGRRQAPAPDLPPQHRAAPPLLSAPPRTEPSSATASSSPLRHIPGCSLFRPGCLRLHPANTGHPQPPPGCYSQLWLAAAGLWPPVAGRRWPGQATAG